MLAIFFSFENFHKYTFGRSVIVRSDHKPLESILKKSLSSAPRRLQGMMMRLQKYNIDVRYACGAKMYIADLLSRAYLPEVGGEDAKEFELVNMIKPLPVSDQKLKEIQRNRGWPKPAGCEILDSKGIANWQEWFALASSSPPWPARWADSPRRCNYKRAKRSNPC